MEFKLKTAIGEVIAVIETHPISPIKNICIGYIKDKPGLFVQADRISDAIEELQDSVQLWFDFQKDCF